ncbi:MAG: hypothetical protein HC882_02665 [Acidobacteria bacterium]|nr:hypothetical protein [Acidobacteriota bacterium]
MRKRKAIVRRGEAEWKGIVDSWSQSGLSHQAFCRREGIALSSFQRWRRRVSRRETPGSFVEITQTAAATGDGPGWQIEIELPSGAVLRFRG